MNRGIEISCKSAFNKLNSKWLPYRWDLNIYRGCEHGCKYCFALYSHDYLSSSKEYFTDIFIKKNIIDNVEREIYNIAASGEVVNIGGVTDSYQPLECEYKFMPEILKIFIKHKIPTIISTKSDLILRDIDLLDELASATYVSIATTITAIDERVRRVIEPNASTTNERFNILAEFAKTRVYRGLHFMPIIPYITDDDDNIDKIFAGASDCGVDYIIPSVLNLRGKTKGAFFEFIRSAMPDSYDKLFELYKRGSLDKDYKVALFSKVSFAKRKYGVSTDYLASMREWKERNKSVKFF